VVWVAPAASEEMLQDIEATEGELERGETISQDEMKRRWASMTKADIEYSTRAVEQLEKLETEIADRIINKLDDVAWNPEHYLKGLKLSNSPSYSLVVGDYRGCHREIPI
jgi:hypothetical protein